MRSVMKATAEVIQTASPTAAPRPLKQAFAPLRGVMALVDKDENKVLELVETGALVWAWDVASVQKDGRKRELRVLPAALADYLKGVPCELEWPDVFSLLTPDGPTITASEIARVLNVSSDHGIQLDRGKADRRVPYQASGAGR